MRFLERDWLSANGVLFDDGRCTALVDTGYAKHRELTVALVRRALGDRPLDLVVNTHLHSDHCGGNAILQHTWGPRTLIPEASADAVREWADDALTYARTGQRCERFTFDGTLADGDRLRLGSSEWRVLHTPGHSPGSVTLVCDSAGEALVGDTLFAGSIGRVDFPTSNPAHMHHSLHEVLMTLADTVRVHPGHGPSTTIGAERRSNPWLQGDGWAEDE